MRTIKKIPFNRQTNRRHLQSTHRPSQHFPSSMSSTSSPQTLFFPPFPNSRSPAFLGPFQFRPCGTVESSSFERSATYLPGVCWNSGMKKFPRFIASAASSTVASSRVVPSDISDVLGEVTIFTAAGEPVMFRDLWDQTQGIAVVALLRHFGCVCCWELASSLRDTKARFDAAGVKLIAVGVGTPDKAQILAERLPFPMDCLYADPTRKAYEVLGLYYGIGRTFFNPASTKVFLRFDGIQKALKNYTINATPDDRSSVLQQGGMFVFKGKELLYARKDEGTGDHASLDDVFEFCCKIPAS